jgi:hypothetical protein
MRMNDTDSNSFDDELMTAAAELATEVTPARDLWPGIEQAIAQPAIAARTVWNNGWAQAAAVLLLVAATACRPPPPMAELELVTTRPGTVSASESSRT